MQGKSGISPGNRILRHLWLDAAMSSHFPPLFLGAVLLFVRWLAARAAMPIVMPAGAWRMVRLAGRAERGVGFKMSCGMAGLAPRGTADAQDWRAIRAGIMRRLRKWRLSLPDGKAGRVPGRSAGVIAALSCVGLVLRHGRRPEAARWPETMWAETLRARGDAGSSRAAVSGQRSGTGRDRSHAAVRRGRKTDPCVSDPCAGDADQRANFLCLIRLGSSASGPRRRFLSSS
ncbi:hypothetical protein SAMN05443432_106239 [Roseovarius litoreus]|uniref:Uncharacterized protein n=1 Tax=Roseovarius litoreus TaxID=1155722 RepID=A0A1M7I2J7_9RHOB|nr:hypothetical protein SAMN05443432_106239 [Roseovarius litoreus]